MTRINNRLLVQNVDGDVVILDEHTGAEIVIPRAQLWGAAMAVFNVALADPSPERSVTDAAAVLTSWKGSRADFVIVDEADCAFLAPPGGGYVCARCGNEWLTHAAARRKSV